MTDPSNFEAFVEAWETLPERWRLYYYLAFQWQAIPTWGRAVIVLQLLIIAGVIIVLALK
jgi:hypothetical protein